MVKCGVLFEVRAGFLNNIQTSCGFKGLNLNSINQLISVMVKCGVLFEVRTDFLYIVQTRCGFKGLDKIALTCLPLPFPLERSSFKYRINEELVTLHLF
jgi:hypothetical protein